MEMQIFSYIAGAAGAGIVGGVLASLWAPGHRITSYIQHFAAGVVIAAVALQVAPEIQRAGAAPAAVLGGFASGGVCMVGVKWLALRIKERERRRRGMPWGLTAAAAIDTAIDGTIIGMGFALAPEVGAILALALGLELFFLTLSVGSSFRQDGASHGTAIAATSGISLLLVVGAVAGSTSALVSRASSSSSASAPAPDQIDQFVSGLGENDSGTNDPPGVPG